MLAVLATSLLISVTPADECRVLDAMIETSFGVRHAERFVVDQAGNQIGAMRTLYSVGERPATFFPVDLNFSGPMTAPDENQLADLMDLFDRSAALSRTYPHYAMALIHAEVTGQRPYLEERFGPLPDALIDDLVERNWDQSAWSCALPDRVVYAAGPAERAADRRASHVRFTRPGFSADGQFALIYRAIQSTSGVPRTSPGSIYGGSLDGGNDWILLERDEDGDWTRLGHAGGTSYFGP